MNHRSYWGYWSPWPLGQPGRTGATELKHIHVTLSSLFHHPPVWPIETIIFCTYYDMNLAIYTNPTTQTCANHKRDKNPIWTSSTTDTVPLLDCLPFLFSGFSSLLGNKTCMQRKRQIVVYVWVCGWVYIYIIRYNIVYTDLPWLMTGLYPDKPITSSKYWKQKCILYPKHTEHKEWSQVTASRCNNFGVWCNVWGKDTLSRHSCGQRLSVVGVLGPVHFCLTWDSSSASQWAGALLWASQDGLRAASWSKAHGACCFIPLPFISIAPCRSPALLALSWCSFLTQAPGEI